MMIEKKPESEKPPKKSLLVTITINPKKEEDIIRWILAAALEFCGIHLQNKIIIPSKKEMEILFEKIKDGEDFSKIMEESKFKIEKIEC